MTKARAAARSGGVVLAVCRLLVLVLVLVLGTGTAAASLSGDIETLRTRYEGAGARAAVLAPRVISGGAHVPLALPEAFLTDDDLPCTTVAVLGAVSTVFGLRLPAPEESRSPPVEVTPSTAGASATTRCGDARADLLELAVEMRSPHAILETLVARSARTLPELILALPGRDPGARARPWPLGPGPAPAALEVRARAFESTFRREAPGGPIERRTAQANARGSGRLELELRAGCHRVAVLGIPGDGNPVFRDLDAELSLGPEATVTDRAESPDAQLTACVGEDRRATLSFVGAPPGAEVLVLTGVTPLPAGLPEAFDQQTRARLARALLRHHAPSPSTTPLVTSFGVQGQTRVPMAVERGQCYLAALAPMDRPPKLVSLVLAAGGEPSEAHSGDLGEGVVLAACARGTTAATLEVDVVGAGTEWALAVWPLSRLPLGVRPR